MNRALTALCVMVATASLAIMACDKSSTEPKPDDPVSKNGVTNATTTAAPAPVTIDEADLSTPADFEEAAEKAIDAKNYKMELTSIEADLNKE